MFLLPNLLLILILFFEQIISLNSYSINTLFLFLFINFVSILGLHWSVICLFYILTMSNNTFSGKFIYIFLHWIVWEGAVWWKDYWVISCSTQSSLTPHFEIYIYICVCVYIYIYIYIKFIYIYSINTLFLFLFINFVSVLGLHWSVICLFYIWTMSNNTFSGKFIYIFLHLNRL